MNQVERDYMKQIDQLVLDASPQTLKKIAEIDRKTQLGGVSFYDVYLSLSDDDRKQILVSEELSKRNNFV